MATAGERANASLTGAPEQLRPVPDPTTLTTDQLRREILALRELLETRLRCADERGAGLVSRHLQDAIRHVEQVLALIQVRRQSIG